MNETNRSGRTELVDTYEDLLDEAVQIMDNQNQRILELEQKTAVLLGRLNAYEGRKNKESGEERDGGEGREIRLQIQEQDLYESETKDVVLKLIRNELKRMEQDPNLWKSRKCHVLQSIIKNNQLSNGAEKITAELKEILGGDGKLNPRKRGRLNKLGFYVESGKHYKIMFRGDSRYVYIVASTEGDVRTNENTVKGVSNMLFGY